MTSNVNRLLETHDRERETYSVVTNLPMKPAMAWSSPGPTEAACMRINTCVGMAILGTGMSWIR